MSKYFGGRKEAAFRLKANKRAQTSLRQRAADDLIVLELTRKYEASLELAAKKAIEAINHIDAIANGSRPASQKLALAKKMLVSSVKMIVSSGISRE